MAAEANDSLSSSKQKMQAVEDEFLRDLTAPSEEQFTRRYLKNMQ